MYPESPYEQEGPNRINRHNVRVVIGEDVEAI